MKTGARVGVSLVDQALSSASNAVLLIAFARISTVEEFAVTSLVLLGITIVLNLARGGLGAQLLLLSGASALRSEAGKALLAALSLGVGVTLIALGITAGTGLSSADYILLSALPGIASQDVLRHVAFAQGRPAWALASDVLWCLGALFALALTWTLSWIEPWLVSTIWTGSSVGALVLVWVGLRVRLSFSGFRMWLGRGTRARLALGLEGALSACNSVLTLTIVTSSLGLVATAGLRGAGAVIGPVSVIMAALPAIAIPELVRRGVNRSGSQLWSRLRWIALVTSVGSLAIGAGALVMPPSQGQWLLGPTWGPASGVLPLMAMEYAALAWMHAAGTGLRTLGCSEKLLAIRGSYFGTCLVSTLALCRAEDVRYVCCGLLVTAIVFACVMVRCLRVHESRPHRVQVLG